MAARVERTGNVRVKGREMAEERGWERESR